MDALSVLALAAATFVLAVSPGPGVLAVTTRSVTAGFTSALVMCVGILLGDIVYILLAVYGLNAIAASLHDLFILFRYLGSAYLIWLGISLFMIAPDSMIGTAPTGFHGLASRSCIGSLLTGFTITLGNPKVIFFYLGFLPTFMNLKTLNPVDVALVCCTSFLVAFFVLASYAYLAYRSRTLFQNAQAKIRLNRAAGCVMTATGIALAADT